MSAMLALIPAHNEQAHISETVRRALRYLPVVVVDDGSTDNTSGCAKDAGASVIRQWPNQGKGKALQTGFHHALATGCDAVVTLDADGQHDPDEIPRFVQAYADRNTDLIIGQRTFSQMPLVRRVANSLGQRAFSWAAGRFIPDNQSGYRLVSRHLMERCLESPETGFEFEMDQIVICLQSGLSLGWVAVRTIYAGEQSHIRPGQHLIQFLRVVWHTRRRMRGRASSR